MIQWLKERAFIPLIAAVVVTFLFWLVINAELKREEFQEGCEPTDMYVYERNPVGWRRVYRCPDEDPENEGSRR